MRTYQINERNERMYQLECKNFECISSQDSVITIVLKEEYQHDAKCKKCGKILTEIRTNYKQLNSI